ncbi:MAG: flavodoxin family protein [Deltaproteobacteria bacterium]|nr:MAG: flavodoxin family protein [Deltaproteobacteria bacterium]
MKVLVLYYSKGGNTRRLAEAIAAGVDEVSGAEAVLKKTDQVSKEDFLEADAVIAGSPVYFGTMAAQLKQVFDEFVSVRKKMENKIGAAFTTAGDVTGGKETTLFSILQALMIYGMAIVGDPMAATGHYGVSCVGKPEEKNLVHGRLLGNRVAKFSLKLSE